MTTSDELRECLGRIEEAQTFDERQAIVRRAYDEGKIDGILVTLGAVAVIGIVVTGIAWLI